MANESVSDKRLELAYEAGQDLLKMQEDLLANTRTRANTLLTASALFVSFSVGVGLINTDPKKGAIFPAWLAIVLLLLVVGVGVSVAIVLWPTKDWCFGPSASKIIKKIDEGKSEVDIRRYVTDAMIDGAAANLKMLERRQNAFRLAAFLLVVEVVALVGGLFLQPKGVK